MLAEKLTHTYSIIPTDLLFMDKYAINGLGGV